MSSGLVLLVAVLGLATAFGLWRRRTDGELRELDAVPGPAAGRAEEAEAGLMRLVQADIGAPLGERATLLQFSSAFCQPCRHTRIVLAQVAGMVPGVTHVELDAESHLELVRRLHVMRTPTVFILDADGAVRRRAAGAPRKADIIAALGEFVELG